VIFDFSHRRMIVEPNLHFKELYEEDMSGMSLTPETVNGTKLFRIREVVANTPASEAGLQADYLITALTGSPQQILQKATSSVCSHTKGRSLL
jgi:hypothetical protein